MPDEVHRESRPSGELRGGVDDLGLLIYERVLPAIPASVGRVRHELIEALTSHDLAPDRHSDVALMVTEAATNAVLHAYPEPGGGPFYVAATLGGGSLTVWVTDFGRGMLPRCDSPGLGLGMVVIGRLCDSLHVSSGQDGAGTCITATFARMKRAAERHADRRYASPAGGGRREMLVEYLHALRATSAELQHDTDAVLAQADLAVARARRQRRARAQ